MSLPQPLPVFDLSTDQGRELFEQRLVRLRQTASAQSEAAQTVARIIEDVRSQGDQAVVRYMRQWTDPGFDASRIRVDAREFVRAYEKLDARLGRAIAQAIEHVRSYQQHIKPRDVVPALIDGAEVGLRFTPVESVGLTVPGGTAVLFSSLIMLAAPALVAGVPARQISIVHPPPTRRAGETSEGDISPLVLATCHMLGLDKVYRIGGAQAVAALALGTASVERVEMIAGPGNIYVQLAKAQLGGLVGSDNGFYGPSEIVTVMDQSARPQCVAADLIAQAEHDPGKCFLIAWSAQVIDRVQAAIARELPRLQRRQAIESGLEKDSAAVLVRDEEEAAQVANLIAAEHVNLAVADPAAWLKRVRHGGEFFLGDQTPVAAGDYYAGPSHCLPTGTTARFASGVSVYTFLKRSGTLWYRQGMSPQTIEAIAMLAEAEGLTAHARSARVRADEST